MRTYYQAQLPHEHLFTNSKRQMLAKYWIESNLNLKLQSNDLHDSLKDGKILAKIVQLLLKKGFLSKEYDGVAAKDPVEKINIFLKAVKDFGLQSSHLFSAHDLIVGENIDSVASTILILAHFYSCKRFAGESNITQPQPNRYTIDLSLASLTNTTLSKSKSETDLMMKGPHQENNKEEDKKHAKNELAPIRTQWPNKHLNVNTEQQIVSPSLLSYHYINKALPTCPKISPSENSPFERPNCVPGFTSHDSRTVNEPTPPSTINSLDDMYETQQSHTPSTSGDSGYGTGRKKSSHTTSDKAQDVFEALFSPPSSLKMQPKNSVPRTETKLSQLFHQKQPQFVKFQTWSTHNKNGSPPPITSSSTTLPQKTKRSRRKTDASLVQPESFLPPPPINTHSKHTRCKSIGSKSDQILSPNTATTISPTDTNNNLELLNDDGQVIARYKLGNIIGKGHFGTVYRALDLISGKTVAIKQINLQDARESDIDDMMQEASLLKSLAHDNIVKYEGFIQTADHMHIVLEYVENGSLLHTLKHFGNTLPENLVASYCHDILQGLVYLHKKDVVHCDLKAANILTTKAGDVKLSDFGVSLNLKLKSHEDNLVSGTPFWMSPEVIELKGASVQSDIWSLGCTIIELCTGKPPYADLLTMTAMFKIVEDDSPPLPEDISDDLKDFLKLCFKKNPVERPKAIHLLYHPWILQNEKAIPNTPATPTTFQESHSANSTMLKNYLQKVVKNDIVPKASVSTATPLKGATSPTSSNQIRQSRPFLSKLNTKPTPDHKHNLTICSFPNGTVQCKLCSKDINSEAYVCKDFCGFLSHRLCHDNNPVEPIPQTPSRRRGSEQRVSLPTLVGPRPTSSVSTQIKEKFSFGRKSTIRPPTSSLGNIMEDSPTPTSGKSFWWKKKSLKSPIN